MKRFSQRDLKRLMKKAGVSLEPMEGVEKVEIYLSGGEVIVVHAPMVTKMDVSGQTTFQVIGQEVVKEQREVEEADVVAEKISEEDVMLVVAQANVDPETARKALEATRGDLAQAIIMLRSSLG